jgi:hypothetical protein
MTTEEFERSLLEADAENIARAWRAQGLPDEGVPIVVENCLRHPGMIATLRNLFRWDDDLVAKAMIDPHGFADEVLADPERQSS